MLPTQRTRWLAVAALLALGGSVSAGTIDLIMTIDGQQEVPLVDTLASGSGTATLDTGTNLLSWDITYQDLSGPAIAAHFHGAAANCGEAGVQVTILPGGGPPAGVIVGSDTLGAGQVADLLAGLWYVNIHTSNHPGGEIRGRVAPLPLDDPLPDIPLGNVHIQLTTLADGLVAPNWGTTAPGDDRLFVTDQPGVLWAIDTMTGDKSVFLDVSAQLVELGIFGPGSFDERGLLGVAFHPEPGRGTRASPSAVSTSSASAWAPKGTKVFTPRNLPSANLVFGVPGSLRAGSSARASTTSASPEAARSRQAEALSPSQPASTRTARTRSRKGPGNATRPISDNTAAKASAPMPPSSSSRSSPG